MGQKHVAVCDHCGVEGDLQDTDKLCRWPVTPPKDWFVAGTVETFASAEWDYACFCSKGCLADWASGKTPNIVPGRSYDLREQAS
jgi:hypothetical protein